MNFIGLFLLLFLCCTATVVLPQNRTAMPASQQSIPGATTLQNNQADVTTLAIKKMQAAVIADSNQFIIRKPFYICKQLFTTSAIKQTVTPSTAGEPKSTRLFIIHGNISYDFFYRSRIDTPVSQQDFQQHTERVYLNILYKEKYPLKIGFVLRQSNSPYFTNFADVNFQFDRSAFNRNFKQDILNKLMVKLPQRPDLESLEKDLEANKKELEKLKGWIASSSTLQKIIEEREREYYKRLSLKGKYKDAEGILKDTTGYYKITNGTDETDSLKTKYTAYADSLQSKVAKKFKTTKDSLTANFTNITDSLQTRFAAFYEKKKAQADSLEKKIQQQQKKADSLRTVVQTDMQKVRQKISRASGEKELKKIAEQNGINIDSMDKFQRKLAAIRNFSIGRGIVDYTELTAQNITITGLNVEYNPSYYAAFAAGKIDYRFRDFFNKKAKTNSQYLVLGRFGWGNKDKRSLILTVFQGRKNQSNFALSDNVSGHVNLLGYSVEGIWKKDENTGLSIEVAKSTIPTGGTIQNSQQTKALWNFSENSNMGINIKAQTSIELTHTKLSGFYRKTGENFQSFSLFSYNTDQTAWQLRADQSAFKNRVTVTGMLRRNDFTNPFTEKTYTSSTVFKSVLVNIRFPKYPAVSVGYYPGTQLYIVDKETIRENAYYMLNASLVYGYHYKGIGMNSSIVYNKYYNQATDSGFVLYKGINYYLSQSIFLKKLQLQGAYSYTKQPELNYYTLESTGDYALKSFLKVGAGIKYNHVNSGSNYWGKRLMLSIECKNWGGFILQYEKSYLPTLNQTLYPVGTGRVSWFKTF